MKLDVILSPKLLPEQFEGTLCTVIDVLRATTTIVTALARGVSKICPCVDADDAKRRAKSIEDGLYLLGGEERGQRISGFHLGNSPLEYLDSNRVANRVVLFSTSNGTPAVKRAYLGSGLPVYLVALINLSAASSIIVKSILDKSFREILLVCAGGNGKPSLEDFFCAGLAVQRVRDCLLKVGISPDLSDCATIALRFAMANVNNPAEVLSASEHGRQLRRIGFAADLEFASQIDKYQVVPVFDGAFIVTSEE